MSWEIASALSDYVIYVVGGLLAWAGSVERRIRKANREDDRLDRYFTGDDDDPAVPGVLKKVDQLDKDVRKLDGRLEQARVERQQEHERVMLRLDDLEKMIDPSPAESETEAES